MLAVRYFIIVDNCQFFLKDLCCYLWQRKLCSYCIWSATSLVVLISHLKSTETIFYAVRLSSAIGLNWYGLYHEDGVACVMRQLLLHACKEFDYSSSLQAFEILLLSFRMTLAILYTRPIFPIFLYYVMIFFQLIQLRVSSIKTYGLFWTQ
jgi:hypothetical protein